MTKRTTERQILFRQPSWWVVVVSGSLLVIFLVAMVRELINGHQVRTQVGRLRSQVATAQQHQQQLKDLIDYLQSPTFQEREARLELGLKKNGESVIVVPQTNSNSNNTLDPNASSSSTLSGGQDQSRPARWWSYFFSSHSPTST